MLEAQFHRCVGETRAGETAPPWMAGFGALSDLSDENRRVLNAIAEEFEKFNLEDIER